MSTPSVNANLEHPRSHVARNWVLAIGTLVGGLAGLSGIADLFKSKDEMPPPRSMAPAPVQTVAPINITIGDIAGGNIVRAEGNGSQVVGGNVGGSAVQSLPVEPAPASAPKERVAFASRPSVASPYERYIDPGVHRVAGTLNVAVALQGLPGFPAGPLKDAVHRALIDRGMTVVPLFRELFMRDGTARRLFAGDASLAAGLKLREHVDSVLLAELRFVGPAQSMGDGLYIREAVLEVHAVDVSSGEIRKVLEIRGKGGGANEELSSINAVDRLQEQVEANIAGWVWV
jgi:hypothetical protein